MEANLYAKQTKERSANFTNAEMNCLKKLIAKHQSILFCKNLDSVTSRKKENVWRLIEREFNANRDTPRTVKQLKYKFDNLKRTAKKAASKEHQEMPHSGGEQPNVDNAKGRLSSANPTSIDGEETLYDDDSINQKILYHIIKMEEDSDSEVVDNCINEDSQLPSKSPAREINVVVEMDPSGVKEQWNFDTSTSDRSPKRPVSSPLKCHPKRRRITQYGNLKKKISAFDNLHELELKKMNDSIRHAQEIHDQKLRHNEERHKLEIEKLELQILILKKSVVS